MRYAFLSDEWFTEVDKLIAAAGDLQIPPAMKDAKVNITVNTANGPTKLSMKDGLFTKGHDASYQTTLTVADDIARKIFVEGDAAAGVQAFLEGKISVEGDLATVVAMQTVEPSEKQMKLTRQIAAITA
jgi:putative sterol carrier protein